MSEFEKLLVHSLPINRQAARVIKKSHPEDSFMPMPNVPRHICHSRNIIATKPIPQSVMGNMFFNPIGHRRDRLQVIGYAKEQTESKSKPARWVVRCDCGNYEHRTRIFRWLGTDAVDMCLECRLRTYKSNGNYSPPKEPAARVNPHTNPTKARID